MTTFIAFLRAVKVGGTGKLPMSELRRICSGLGFTDVRTYIASGNVVLGSDDGKMAIKAALEAALEAFSGRKVDVIVRTAAEIRDVLDANPFPDANPSHTLVTLLDEAVADDALESAAGQANEKVVLGEKAIYVYYPDGMSRSKLRIPAARRGTARNINTIRRMVELSAGSDR